MSRNKNTITGWRRIAVACLGMTAACVKNPDNIKATYVPFAPYESLQCSQLSEEIRRVSINLNDIAEKQRQNFVTDTALLTVGLVIFWPALLAMPATTDRSTELGRLRGEYDALQTAMARRCTTAQSPAAPGDTIQTVASATVPDTILGRDAVNPTPLAVAHTTAIPAFPVSPASVEIGAILCPASGTVAQRSNDTTIYYHGSATDNPDMCLYEVKSPGRTTQSIRELYSLWDGDRARGNNSRELIRSVLYGAIGTTIRFDALSQNAMWQLSFRLDGMENINTGGKTFATNRIVKEMRGTGANFYHAVTTFWLDRQTGLIVKRAYDLRNGTPATGDRSFELVAISLPPARQAAN